MNLKSNILEKNLKLMILLIISWMKIDKLIKIKFIKNNSAKKPWFKANKKKMIKFKKSIFIANRKAREKYENDLYLTFIKEKEIIAQ